MRAYLGICVLIGLVAVGCVESTTDYTLNPNGSGKVAVLVKTSLSEDSASTGPDRSGAVALGLARRIIESSKGVSVWKAVSCEALEDGSCLFRGTAYFDDLNALAIHEVQVLLKFSWMHAPDSKTATMEWKDATRGKKEKEGPSEKQDKTDRSGSLEEKLKIYDAARTVIMSNESAVTQERATFHLPGKVIEIACFMKDKNDTVRITMTNKQLIEALGPIAKDEQKARELESLRDVSTLDDASVAAEFMEGLFGERKLPRVVVAELRPQFDYAAEVAEARKMYPALLEQLGSDDSPADGKPSEADSPGPVESDKATGAQVKVVGLNIGKGLPEAAKTNVRMIAVGDRGTDITLLVACPGKRMVAVDDEACGLTMFADDMGTDLSQRAQFQNTGAKFSDDGHCAVITLHSSEVPAPGATSISVKGTLAIVAASGEKTEEQKSVPLVEGATVTAGPGSMTISSVRTETDQKRKKVTFSYSQPDHLIKSIRFFDESGKQIKVRSAGSFWFKSGKAKSRTRAWAFPKEMKKVTVKVTYYDPVEILKIAFDLSVDVSL